MKANFFKTALYFVSLTLLAASCQKEKLYDAPTGSYTSYLTEYCIGGIALDTYTARGSAYYEKIDFDDLSGKCTLTINGYEYQYDYTVNKNIIQVGDKVTFKIAQNSGSMLVLATPLPNRCSNTTGERVCLRFIAITHPSKGPRTVASGIWKARRGSSAIPLSAPSISTASIQRVRASRSTTRSSTTSASPASDGLLRYRIPRPLRVDSRGGAVEALLQSRPHRRRDALER